MGFLRAQASSRNHLGAVRGRGRRCVLSMPPGRRTPRLAAGSPAQLPWRISSRNVLSNGLRGSDRKYRRATGKPFQYVDGLKRAGGDLVRRRRIAGLHEYFRLAPVHYVSFAGCDERFDSENHPLPEARAAALGAVWYLKAGVKIPAPQAVACEVVYGLVAPPVNECRRWPCRPHRPSLRL